MQLPVHWPPRPALPTAKCGSRWHLRCRRPAASGRSGVLRAGSLRPCFCRLASVKFNEPYPACAEALSPPNLSAVQISDADRRRQILMTDKCTMTLKKWRDKGDFFRVDRYRCIEGRCLYQIMSAT
jgi:hypothetical protein